HLFYRIAGSNGSLSRRFFLTSASSGGLPFGSNALLLIHLVVINQLNKSHLGIISQTILQLNDPGITARPGGHFFRNLTKQDRNRLFILKIAEYGPTRM